MLRMEPNLCGGQPRQIGGVLTQLPRVGSAMRAHERPRRSAESKERTMSLSDEDITTTPTSATSGGGDADQGDTDEEQVDPAGSDPAGKDLSGGDADGTDGDADGTDGGDADGADGGDADGTDGAGS
jgi:hypothetical protein